ncbi:hypothetical protein HPB48_019006 [Haemaphysalis longicornis]|uniref:Transposable element P transposase-like RNase H domain-containing protein n=1 Tax=Haemaphysalis longicornis TaxID=44386 RepID=A0A9J6GKQ9_HAELO|nr:hypothetical protein HPB48_019006 [Haemaphysalis longicornis]
MDHFTEDQFEKWSLKGKRLKSTAVPSIFPGSPFPAVDSATARGLPQEPCEHSLSPGFFSAEEDPIPSSERSGHRKSEREAQLERQLNLERKRRYRAEEERDGLRNSLSTVLAPDQMYCLHKGTLRGRSWTPGTMQKALHLKVACGSRGYDFVKENVVPLPAKRTLQQQTEHIKFVPGILEEVFTALKQKVSTMRPEEKHACLLMDEMQISAGLDYDASTGTVIVRPHILCVTNTCPPPSHALNQHCFGGAKLLSFDAAKVKDVLFDIIRRSEEIGITMHHICSRISEAISYVANISSWTRLL